MSNETRTPRTARGPEAVAAALDDLELNERLDTSESPALHERFYDLTRLDDELTSPARRAAELDWLTPDEAIEDLAAAVGRESPYDGSDTDDDYGR